MRVHVSAYTRNVPSTYSTGKKWSGLSKKVKKASSKKGKRKK